ncbi:ABC transporter ATP-binding protein [Corynebacterium pygosceleis]|uniref:ABC transporter ATP-binding protein n=1 Tax=Corynebacterium pygosceleis TaxID=2800406 RepID=A0A9Q4CA21_9CORY|nr:ABC transporter ATP-binding protein [Corynebacterium pygosceleis]MCK7637431.1 ABC transporter ATP-binding protein [Corynebacterium pygosceleis]MCL0119793.1 ABC transporter ATP-binding protein [Corynebacterium pygosceleis]MCX7445041.1 ABC transporter ATP-binding protein [Corynebacterium pygosceleis]MCX7468240.1 ABC transporter ATP-binding protein [Corynebacterium pygosceleis]
MSPNSGYRLRARGLTAGYGETEILHGIDTDVPEGRITALIGPNGCGKSTLLSCFSTLLPYRGSVTLDGRDLGDVPRRERAKLLALLPQQPTAPDGLTVAQLVARGRHPHQSWWSQWSTGDEAEVGRALETTGVLDLADRTIDQLSGGQRQRVWIAMTLAQDTPTLLLDEPTTYLDLAHSIDVLSLVRRLCDREGKTVVMVLHDLNLAVRYADHLLVMGEGRMAAAGAPGEVMDADLLREVFGLDARVVPDPVTGGPMIVPELV